MSLTFMVFMAIPIIAPGIGQVILLAGPWHYIFLFMAGLAALICDLGLVPPARDAALRISPAAQARRRSSTASGIVVTNRVAFSYGLARHVPVRRHVRLHRLPASRSSSSIYGLGPLFPARLRHAWPGSWPMSSFVNSRIVQALRHAPAQPHGDPGLHRRRGDPGWP